MTMTFGSPVEAIANLKIQHAQDKRVYRNANVVTYGGVTIIQSKTGKLLSPEAGSAHYRPGILTYTIERMFNALAILGIVTHEDMNQYIKEGRDRQEVKRLQLAAGYLNLVKSQGVKLTEEQQSLVDEFIG